MSHQPRILVYTDGEVIGDGIIRLPFAAALKQAGAHITWVSSGYSVYANTLSAMAERLIDLLIIIPARKMRWRDFIFGPGPLRHQHFDLIIDTQRSVGRALWLKRVGHSKLLSSAGNYILSSARPAEGRPEHFFTMLTQLGELGLEQQLPIPTLTLPKGNWAAQADALLPTGPRYVGFITGAGKPDKCWPLEHFIAIAQHVVAQDAVPVFFLGPQEQVQADAIRAAVPTAILPLNNAHTGTASPSPYLTIALAKKLSAALANDSGGGHLLAAGNAPLVTLFRSDTVRKKFLPRTPRVIGITPEDSGTTSMQEIPVEAVQTALDALLA